MGNQAPLRATLRCFPGLSWFLAVSFICSDFLLTGCGAGSGTIAPPSQAVAITTQPASQTVPIGEAATFTVTATGTAPLSYQWSENGIEIAGATGASYITAAVSLGAGGLTALGSFDVTVSNSVNSITSNAAKLTAGPRSPKAGDLRYLLFQQVDLPGLFGNYTSGAGNVQAGPSGYVSNWIDSAVGTPLGMGSSFLCGGNECAWPYAYQLVLPPGIGIDMYYRPGNYSTYAADLESYAAPNVVFTSLDLEPAASVYAVSWAQTTQAGGFDVRMDPAIPPGADQQAEIQAQVANDGAQSRVVTAVSFDASGNAILISYGWQGDTTTVYESQTTVAPASKVLSAATTLAGQGYFISAFGGNDTSGYTIVGMRVQGDSLPRLIGKFASTSQPPYSTPVVYLDQSGVGILNEQ